MNNIIMLVGFPASGKSTLADSFIRQGYQHLNRDKVGGRTAGLLPTLEQHLKFKRNVVIDNTMVTSEKRRPFIDMIKRHKRRVTCIFKDTKIEDCQINALNRMWTKYGRIFFTADDIKEHRTAKKDPGIFPVSVLFKFRKELIVPSTDEGFDEIQVSKFRRQPWSGTTKAILLDYDGTIRRTDNPLGYPVIKSDITIKPNRKEILTEWKNKGYYLLGVSNQSGIAKGTVTAERAKELFDHTNKLLGHQIMYRFCPHRSNPISCYCRKPQSGIGVEFIRKYDLTYHKCIMVGDYGTDKSFAKRLGIDYVDEKEFFK